MREKFAELLNEQAGEMQVQLTARQIEQFYQYFELLTEWNKVMNLTAITQMEDVVTKHFVDSLSIIRIFPELAQGNWSVMDVGTGAGFPGIPLKIAFPEIKITLLDSLNKRIKFLQEVKAKLELQGVEALHGRAEDYGRQKEYREKFDCCVSRAVANLATLSEYCVPFVKTGGCFIPYKSGKVEEERRQAENALKILGCRVEKMEEFVLPSTDASRVLVMIRKEKVLSKKYPRKAGMPSKEPLK